WTVWRCGLRRKHRGANVVFAGIEPVEMVLTTIVRDCGFRGRKRAVAARSVDDLDRFHQHAWHGNAVWIANISENRWRSIEREDEVTALLIRIQSNRCRLSYESLAFDVEAISSRCELWKKKLPISIGANNKRCAPKILGEFHTREIERLL